MKKSWHVFFSKEEDSKQNNDLLGLIANKQLNSVGVVRSHPPKAQVAVPCCLSDYQKC
jgi:hypothetical protein